MKRFLLWLTLCLILTGCANGGETPPIQEVEPVLLETTASEPDPALNEDQADMAAYAPVLRIYRQALEEGWDQAQCAGGGISLLTAYIMQTENPLQNMCYAFHDLDGDGDRELLIAPAVSDGFVDNMVFEAYDLSEGEPRLLFTGWERNRFYLCMENDGTVWFVNEGSGGAAVRSWLYSRYDGNGLKVEKSLIFDGGTFPDSPWFLGTDDSRDLTKMESINEETAQTVIASYDAIKCSIHRGFSHQYTFDMFME